jgi:hypothetical protein
LNLERCPDSIDDRVRGEQHVTILHRRSLTWPLSGALIVAVWVFGWSRPIRTASSAADSEPTGDLAFIGAHVLVCLIVGFLIPRLAIATGPILLAPAILWLVIEVTTYDGSQGASFWPLALIMILFSMPMLSVIGMLGRALRLRLEKVRHSGSDTARFPR